MRSTSSPSSAAKRFHAVLTADIGKMQAAERSLDGICLWVETAAPEAADLAIEGAAALKAAVITVVVHYATPDPLT